MGIPEREQMDYFDLLKFAERIVSKLEDCLEDFSVCIPFFDEDYLLECKGLIHCLYELPSVELFEEQHQQITANREALLERLHRSVKTTKEEVEASFKSKSSRPMKLGFDELLKEGKPVGKMSKQLDRIISQCEEAKKELEGLGRKRISLSELQGLRQELKQWLFLYRRFLKYWAIIHQERKVLTDSLYQRLVEIHSTARIIYSQGSQQLMWFQWVAERAPQC